MSNVHRHRNKRPGKKLLGLDLGERRIGVAISDDSGIIASPVTTIDTHFVEFEHLAELATRFRVDAIIVGLPLTMSGAEGFQARRARTMAAELEKVLTIPIAFWDERLTTAIADRVLDQNGSRNKKSSQRAVRRDAVAAAVMLQSFLDAHPDSPRTDVEN